GIGAAMVMLTASIGISAAAAGVPGVKTGINSVLDTLGISNSDDSHGSPDQPKKNATPSSANPQADPSPSNVTNSSDDSPLPSVLPGSQLGVPSQPSPQSLP